MRSADNTRFEERRQTFYSLSEDQSSLQAPGLSLAAETEKANPRARSITQHLLPVSPGSEPMLYQQKAGDDTTAAGR